jgi:hypothetical protein
MTYSDPQLLTDYKFAPRGAGLYVIGATHDPGQPVISAKDQDPYLWNFPENLTLEYVGMSVSSGSGVRGRLSCHARGKGSKGVAELIRQGKTLWFVTVMGRPFAEYEVVLLCLQAPGQFAQNQRGEFERSAARQYRAIRAAMTQHQRDFYDNLDMGEHGNGM